MAYGRNDRDFPSRGQNNRWVAKYIVEDCAEQCAGVVRIQDNLHARLAAGTGPCANGRFGEQTKTATLWG